jgi:hypothetical protein
MSVLEGPFPLGSPRRATNILAAALLAPFPLNEAGVKALCADADVLVLPMPSLPANSRKSSIGPPPASYQRRELTEALARALRSSGTSFLSLGYPRKSKRQGLRTQRTLLRSGGGSETAL